jgi:lipoprotein-anchoring transpeptidase ErfK/SrfK
MKLSGLARLALLLLAVIVLAVGAWQAISLLAPEGLTLAPVVGQVYLGESWMVTPTPAYTPTPVPSPIIAIAQATAPTPAATATPTIVPTPPAGAATPIPARATPDPYLVAVAQRAGIDPDGTYVIVNQNVQQMTVVQDGQVLRVLPISSGDPDSGWYTPAWSGYIGQYWGTFTANGVSADDAWYLFQAGGSILIHSLPYTTDPDGTKVFQGANDLGIFPASRGCIRIDPEEARWFTQWGPEGVPIVILPWDSGTGRSG